MRNAASEKRLLAIEGIFERTDAAFANDSSANASLLASQADFVRSEAEIILYDFLMGETIYQLEVGSPEERRYVELVRDAALFLHEIIRSPIVGTEDRERYDNWQRLRFTYYGAKEALGRPRPDNPPFPYTNSRARAGCAAAVLLVIAVGIMLNASAV